MSIAKLLQISRSRFWMYTFGPFLIGLSAARGPTIMQEGRDGAIIALSIVPYVLLITLAVIYSLVIINILIYGVNDLADEDTDALNEKKSDYEHRLARSERHTLRVWIWVTQLVVGLPLIILLSLLLSYRSENPRRVPIIMMVVWLFFCLFYSLPPIRAKAHPFIDGVFNVLYIIPAVLGWMVAMMPMEEFSWIGFVAGWLWAMAMHAYSAIPDISPDREAGLTTTAVYLGAQGTLIYCGILWIVAAILGSLVLGPWLLLLLIPYLVMLALSRSGDIMSLYRRFPRINTGVGFVLFWGVVLGW